MRVMLVGLMIAGAVAVGCLVGCGQKKEAAAPAATPAPEAPPAPPSTTSPTPPATVKTGLELGKQIFTTGVGSMGKHIDFEKGSAQFRTDPGGCAACHGENGLGKEGPHGKTPDIRGSALLEPRNGKPAVYTLQTLERAITQGIDETGKPLEAGMPRWKMTDDEFNAVVDYLKSLDKTGAPKAAKPAPAAKSKPTPTTKTKGK